MSNYERLNKEDLIQELESLEGELDDAKDEIAALESLISELECDAACADEWSEEARSTINTIYEARNDKERFDSLMSELYYDVLGRVS